MEYKFSNFMVNQPYQGGWLLFSTLTCSMVHLEEKIYQSIFVNADFEKHPEEVAKLEKMGFLLPSGMNELEYLSHLRHTAQESVNGKTYFYLICPTMACNARCYYCFENGSRKKHMSLQTAEDVVQFILRTKVDGDIGIQWFGGEPLLGEKTIDYITARLKESGVSFRSKIITNGYLLDDHLIAKAITDWRVDVVQVTIDDIGPKYNAIKNYKTHPSNQDPYDRVIRNVHNTGKHIKVRVRVNFNPNDTSHAKRVAQTLMSEFENEESIQVYVAPIDSDDIPPISSDFKALPEHPYLSFVKAFDKDYLFGNPSIVQPTLNNDALKVFRRYFLRPITMPCLAASTSYASIDSEGFLYPCHRQLGRIQYSCGNVRDGYDFENQWWQYFHDLTIDEECKNCPLLPMCQGGCKHRKLEHGKLHSCSPIKGCVEDLIVYVKEKHFPTTKKD